MGSVILRERTPLAQDQKSGAFNSGFCFSRREVNLAPRIMTKLVAQILFFPLAALALGAVNPWSQDMKSNTAKLPATHFPDEFNRVTWEEAEPRVESGEWLLVDARDEEQFNAQHIPGAVSLPSYAFPELLAFFAEEHGRNKVAVIYCGTEECDLSVELATRLRGEVGWNDVRILEGGFLGWRRRQP
jgi:rhodanese-related sulfurtransferase